MDSKYVDLRIAIMDKRFNTVKSLTYRCIDIKYIHQIIDIVTNLNSYMNGEYRIEYVEID